MLLNNMHFPNKTKNIAKYGPFVGQFWCDQVLLSDSLRLSEPLLRCKSDCEPPYASVLFIGRYNFLGFFSPLTPGWCWWPWWPMFWW